MSGSFDVVVVGGGVIGLATAMCLMHSRPGTRLVVLEKESALAQHQTGHNSGVIHSGLYYKPDSLKARNCRTGYVQLLEFCRTEGIPYEICGKVVVATSAEEIPRMEELHRRGIANGLRGLRRLGPAEIREVEPHCSGVAGLLVPETGIIDYGALARKYGEKILEMGARIHLNEEVIGLRTQNDRVDVIGKTRTWTARLAIICAGLQADRLARMIEPELPLRILPFRGEYYRLKQSAPHLVNHLIYPVPDPAFPFLGVHFTRMIGGDVECGPNAVFAFGREAYRKTDFNIRDTWEALTWPGFRKVARRYWRSGLGEFRRSISKKAFVGALQKLIPEIKADHLEPADAGVRAQACDREGYLLDDFNIRTNGNVIQVCNVPSPAATASLAIGQLLADRAISLSG